MLSKLSRRQRFYFFLTLTVVAFDLGAQARLDKSLLS